MQQSVHWANEPDTGPKMKEHKRALTSENVAQSVVAEHAIDKMHMINWKEAQVLDSHPHHTQRCTLEAWHIRS